jgi:hypothetical protein
VVAAVAVVPPSPSLVRSSRSRAAKRSELRENER